MKNIGQKIIAKAEKEIRTRTGIAESRFQEIIAILMNNCISQDSDSLNISHMQFSHIALRARHVK